MQRQQRQSSARVSRRAIALVALAGVLLGSVPAAPVVAAPVYLQWIEAEKATNGYLLNAAGIDPREPWGDTVARPGSTHPRS